MITGGSKEASVFILNLKTLKMKAKKPMNIQRDNHGLVMHNNRVFALGGYCAETKNCTLKCEEYNVEKDKWKKIKGMNFIR